MKFLNQNELFSLPISPQRLRRAREMRGITQAELANEVGIDQSHIAFLETGMRSPSPDVLESLSEFLGLPASYFRQPVKAFLSEGSLRYRAKSTLRRREITIIRNEAEHFLEIALKISEQVNAVPIKLKPLSSTPEGAANDVRELIGASQKKPLAHLTRHFEKLGGMVLMLGAHGGFDGFADWAGVSREIPVVALTHSSPDRFRMNIGHEIGHLVLHKDALITQKQAEADAFRFAAELLLPEKGVLDDLRLAVTNLHAMLQLKEKWGVSIQALVRRARDLSSISERQYRTLNAQIGKLGWKLQEPDVCGRFTERPLAIRRMAEVAFGSPLPFRQMERTLHVPANQLRLFFDKYSTGSPDITVSPLTRKNNTSTAVH